MNGSRRTPIGSDSAAGFEAFFRDRYVALVRLAVWMGIDSAGAEDLAQEALRRTYDRWHEVGSYDHPSAFVRRVLINLVATQRQRRRTETTALGVIANEDRHNSADLRTHRWIDPNDPLWQAVGGLPDQQRAAIALRYLDDLDTEEIAAALGCSAATVRVHLHRAHQRLAQQLNDSGEDVHFQEADR